MGPLSDRGVGVLQSVQGDDACCDPVGHEILSYGDQRHVVQHVLEACRSSRHDGRQNPWAFHDVDCALEHFLDHVDP